MGPGIRAGREGLRRGLIAVASRFARIATGVVDAVLTPACWGCGALLPRLPPHRLLLCPECSPRFMRPEHPLCPTCGNARPSFDGTDGTCARCAADPPPFRRARALFVYEGGVPKLVLRLKYSHAFWLAPALGRAMAAAAWSEGIRDADLVVPVPLTARRMCRRGYNQAGLLGRAAARALGIPLDAAALRRVRDPGPQDHHGRQARRDRVRGCFEVRAAARVAGRRVLLVDDVVTTGATAGECARVLLAAGAASVDVMACAMALGQGPTAHG